METAPAEIIVNPSRSTDRAATITAARKGTGAVLELRMVGARAAVRTESLGLTNAAREALIVALGGTP